MFNLSAYVPVSMLSRRFIKSLCIISLLCLFGICHPAAALAVQFPSADWFGRSVLPRYAAEQDWGTIGTQRKAAFEATQSGKFEEAERKWTELIEQLPIGLIALKHVTYAETANDDTDGIEQAEKATPHWPAPAA